MKRKTTRRTYRGPIKYRPGEIVRRHQPSRISAQLSPFEKEVARVNGELREAQTVESHAMRSLTKAADAVERALAAFLPAAEANQHAEAFDLQVKLLDAERELRLAQKQHADCRRDRLQLEGEWLNYARFQ